MDGPGVSCPGAPLRDVYSNLSQIRPVYTSEEDLPNCPVISPFLNGPLKVTIPENLTMEQVAEKNPLVEVGGQYQPPDCWTRHHTAVLAPYYGQAQHLQHLLFHLHPFLQRQQLHYTIYVVNRVNNTAFHRGELRNVGFWEAMQEEDRDDDRNLYVCDIFPAHVSVAIDKFNYTLPYGGYLGGVFALRPVHYLINGFPNTHRGWDREDSDIAARWRCDGGNSLGYRLLSKELQALDTNLTVGVNVQSQDPQCQAEGKPVDEGTSAAEVHSQEEDPDCLSNGVAGICCFLRLPSSPGELPLGSCLPHMLHPAPLHPGPGASGANPHQQA
ncbi:hypothetical protein MC885_019300 [Smutsia gigantea]|nr:hypothetical protein MC885_019300 [Smutsia gigantea]